MIRFDNGGLLVEEVSELPRLRGEVVYQDLETTSRDPRKKSTDPWRDCWIAGIAVTVDDLPECFYVPVGHADGFGPNLPREAVIRWQEDIWRHAKVWCNQNVKYDRHALANDFDLYPAVQVRCTLAGAKLYDSDLMFKGGYGLDNLARRFLNEEIGHLEEAFQCYLGKANKDYGRVPRDLMGEYACQDVLTTRRVDKFVEANLPDPVRWIWGWEQQVTEVLTRMERRGVVVDPQELKVKELKLLAAMLAIEERLYRLTGMHVSPASNDDCYDLLCNHYGLPVLGFTDTKDKETDEYTNPSFKKDILKKYLVYPNAPVDVVRLLLAHRKLGTLKGFFVTSYQELNIDGVLHPEHNQMVRTGRLSAKRPNSQQLSHEAKELVHPRPGCKFLNIDQSQIEYRVIAHYIRDGKTIRAYCEDPDVDFHDWVANLCGMDRQPAKTMNFMGGYGGGREKTESLLVQDETVVGAITERVRQLVAEGRIKPEDQVKTFQYLASRKATDVYDGYHANLPTLKATSRKALQSCKATGYVATMGGRRRHIPGDRAHIAFNACCQGTAADFMKVAMVKAERFLEEGGYATQLLLQVHDAVLFEGPEEEIDRLIEPLVEIVEDTSEFPRMRVPVRAKYGVSSVSWAACDDEKLSIPQGRRFERFRGQA